MMPESITQETMAPDALATHFREQLGERVVSADVAYDQVTVTVDPASLGQVALFCKQQLGMTFFDFLGGIDEREEGFSIVVRVYNHRTRQAVTLKAMVPGGREEPRITTLSDVYAGANWHERETYDMFGIVFEGHPALLPRILTVENFEGWPLRKEFKLASRIVKPWPGAKEPGGGEDEEKKAEPGAAPGADPDDRAAGAKAKAERAKVKAAAARKRKAEEKAQQQAEESGEPADTETSADVAADAETPADGAADAETPADGAADAETSAVEETAAEDPDRASEESVDDAEPGSARDAAAAAAGQPTKADTPDPTTPEGAAQIADTAVAKDAAAGTTAGQDVATGEQAGSDEPERDAEAEAEVGDGGPAQDSGTPGVEAEGVHDLDDSSARPSIPRPSEDDLLESDDDE
jgi:NADH-quinone oxidoreductase subunit C